MNYKYIRKTLSRILLIESIFLIIPMIFSLLYKEPFRNYLGFIISSLISFIFSKLLKINTKTSNHFGAKEGLLIVGLSWILLCLIGALPYTISAQIPNYIDSFFETCSGFSTTGSSIVNDIEIMSKSYLFYRSFTQWIGGMGVLVFMLAFTSDEDNSIHILRAESTGPSVGKLSSKMKFTTRTLYLLYLGLTVSEIILLTIGHNPLFDSICISLSTTATGGFSIYNSGLANISIYSQYVVIIFMLLSGINFALYYFIFVKTIKAFFNDEELKTYIFIVALATIIITINIFIIYSSLEQSFRTSLFQVVSIITTTGFSTVDYNIWPSLSLFILCILMLIGSCAGSTAGGIKISRLLIVTKSNFRRLNNKLNSDKVKSIKINNNPIDEDTIHETKTFFSTYIIIIIIFTLLISIDGTNDIISNITASLSSISNVGPGIGSVGPSYSYDSYSYFSKFLLSIEMLIGRLELYPILVMLFPSTWRKY